VPAVTEREQARSDAAEIDDDEEEERGSDGNESDMSEGLAPSQGRPIGSTALGAG
jgi:hypothetical protein